MNFNPFSAGFYAFVVNMICILMLPLQVLGQFSVALSRTDGGEVTAINNISGVQTNIATIYSGTLNFNFGDSLTFDATPDQGYRFVRWDGVLPAGLGETDPSPTIVAPAESFTLVGVFERSIRLSVSVLPVGFGSLDGVGAGTVSVTRINGAVTNGNPESFVFSRGDQIQLTAFPDKPGGGPASFVYEWGGDVGETILGLSRPHPESIDVILEANEGESVSREITILFSRESIIGSGYGDLDADRLADVWEIRYELDPQSVLEPNGTFDNPDEDLVPGTAYIHPWIFGGDGFRGGQNFYNELEQSGFDGQYNGGTGDDPRTDPNLLDTDRDGLPDGWEYYFWEFRRNREGLTWVTINPINLNGLGADDDGDGLDNLAEFNNGTDPTHCDTDGDGMDDKWEVDNGLNPLDPNDAGQNPDGDVMVSNDGLFHDEVYRRGAAAMEAGATAFDPRSGFFGGGQGNPNTTGYNNLDEYLGRDRIGRIQWNDDGRRIADASGDATQPRSDDGNAWDTDRDGMPDGWELYVGLNPNTDVDRDGDLDSDNLNNLDEWRNRVGGFGDADNTWSNKLLPTDPGAITDGGGGYRVGNIEFAWRNVWIKNDNGIARYDEGRGRDLRVFYGTNSFDNGWETEPGAPGINPAGPNSIAYVDMDGSGGWTWEDTLFVDVNGDSTFDAGDTMLNTHVTNGIPAAAFGSAALTSRILYNDRNNNTQYDLGEEIWRDDYRDENRYDASSDEPIWGGGHASGFSTPDGAHGYPATNYIDYFINKPVGIFWGRPGSLAAPTLPFVPATDAAWLDLKNDREYNGETVLVDDAPDSLEQQTFDTGDYGVQGRGLMYVYEDGLGNFWHLPRGTGTPVVIQGAVSLTISQLVENVVFIDKNDNQQYDAGEPAWIDDIVADGLYNHDRQIYPAGLPSPTLVSGDEGSQLGLFFYHNDPHPADTDYDGLPDGSQGVIRGERDMQTNPTSIDTDFDALPDGWETYAGTQPLLADASAAQLGNLDPTDPEIENLILQAGTKDLDDPDRDGLPNNLEYWTGTVYEWMHIDIRKFPNTKLVTRLPMNWDYRADTFEVMRNWMPLFLPPSFSTCTSFDVANGQRARTAFPYHYYHTTRAVTADTDDDGMDDYWEIYHGLNPTKGSADYLAAPRLNGTGVRSSGSGAKSGFFTVGNSDFTNAPYFTFGADGVEFSSISEVAGSVSSNTVANHEGPFNFGLELMDPDGDGLPNLEEYAYESANNGRAFYHTDPTPMQRTDPVTIPGEHPTRPADYSFVRDNYTFDNTPFYPRWLWVGDGAFPFTFEVNEGFDTDNDGFGDYAELNDSIPNSTGGSDPVNALDPVRNRAILLNPSSNDFLRTLDSWVVNTPDHLTTFTVEAWVMPLQENLPDQTVVERSFQVQNDPLVGRLAHANFRLGLRTNNLPYIMYNGRGTFFGTPVSAYAVAPSTRRIATNVWTHLAATYDGQDLRLFVDGVLARRVATREVPATGYNEDLAHRELSSTIVGASEAAFRSDTPLFTETILGDDRYDDGLRFNTAGYSLFTLTWQHERPVPVAATNFFAGYIDELRVWDKVRTDEEITENRASKLARDGGPSLSATLEHYFSFDDTPDVSIQWTNVLGAAVPDEPRLPQNLTAIQGNRLIYHRKLPAWELTPQRSTVYFGTTNTLDASNSYNYVVTAEDVALHEAIFPPRDDYHNMERDTNGMFTGELPDGYPNSTNPYEDRKGITRWNWERPLRDLVFLNHAQADGDIFNRTAWMSGGAPLADPDGLDADGDGLPDNWETFYGLNPYDASGENGADGDPDQDGLTNQSELQAGTNPLLTYSDDGQEVSDALQDADRDGLSNIYEQNISRTRLDVIDTDDDGLTDKQEVDQALDPLDSLSPYVMRYLANPDGLGYLSIPQQITSGDKDSLGSRTSLTNWTLEAAVRLRKVPDPAGDPAILIQRRSQPSGYVNYELGVEGVVSGTGANATTNAILYTRFQSDLGLEYKVMSSIPLTLDKWTFVGAKFGDDERPGHTQLGVFQDTVRVARDVTDIVPATGPAYQDLIIASNLVGDLDEIRVWSVTRTDQVITDLRGKSLLFGTAAARMGAFTPSAINPDGTFSEDRGSLTRVGDDTLRIASNFTLSAWIKIADGGGTIIARRAGSNSEDNTPRFNYNLRLTESGVPQAVVTFEKNVEVFNDFGTFDTDANNCRRRYATFTLDAVNPVSDNQWHHIALTYYNDTLAIMADGAVVASSIFPPPDPSEAVWDIPDDDSEFNPPRYAEICVDYQTLAMSQGNVVIADGINGYIDEVAIYNTGYTPEDIRSFYRSKTPTDRFGIVSLFDFDNLEDIDSLTIRDAAQPGEVATRTGAETTINIRPDANAPISASSINLLIDLLALYLPFDDGRYVSNTVSAVQDFSKARDPDFAGALLPDNTAIDFAPFFNIYTNYTGAMAYPASFPLPYDSPWDTDSDLDGMPDVFEQYFRLDPNFSDSSENVLFGPDDDLDGDDLSNLFEYYAGTDPTFWDSNGNGISDFDDDADDDGLSNGSEQLIGTHPRKVDTDDDGLTDGVESGAPYFSDPISSMDPKDPLFVITNDVRFAYKSMVLDGKAYQIPAPNDDARRFNASSWTVECWLYPMASTTGRIVSYQGASYSNATVQRFDFYALGVTNLHPYISARTAQGRDLIVGGDATMPALPLNRWTHIAGVFDDEADALSLYIDGVQAAKLQAFEPAISGTATADQFPGQAYIGDTDMANMLVDETRIWSIARSQEKVIEGIENLVLQEERNLVSYFRFDDGRAGDTATAYVSPTNDLNFTSLDHSEGAEDYARPMKAGDLATPWRYSLRGITFTNRAVMSTSYDYDDVDGDALPDGWESRRLGYVVPFTSFLGIERAGFNTDFFTREKLVLGNNYPAASLATLGWQQDLTPIRSKNDDRWFKTHDAAWMIRDVFIPDDVVISSVEMRIAYDDDTNTLVYVNGQLLDLGSLEARDSFFFSEGYPDCGNLFEGTTTRFVPNVPLVHGRNRIAVQMINSDGNDDGVICDFFYEYFNMELLLNGTEYLIRRGEDQQKENQESALWWTYYNRSSQSLPPLDPLGARWFDRDYGLDNLGDFDGDGLLNIFEARTASNPRASDSDGDGVLDSQEDYDLDGLVNIDEQRLGSDPRLVDTDDDGYRDGFEHANGWDPANSLSPGNGFAAIFNGSPGSYIEMPVSARFALPGFLIEALIAPDAAVAAPGSEAVIARRSMGNESAGSENFVLGLDVNRIPFARFRPLSGAVVSVTGPSPLPAGQPTMLAMRYDEYARELSLWVNGVRISYVKDFDPPVYNSLAWPVQRMGEGYAGALLDVRFSSITEVLTNAMRIGTQTNLVAWYRFDDGTDPANAGPDLLWGTADDTGLRRGQVEDFTQANDWETLWRNAATLYGSITFTYVPSTDDLIDSDNDGLPDSWEIRYNLDPLSGAGNDGPWGDPDGDGLNNRAEYLAGTDPLNPDTNGDGVLDYFALDGSGNQLGELYTDGDGMDDAWEAQYPQMLSHLLYDADLDPDGDGWDNYAEFMAGTDPGDTASHPEPEINAHISYLGTNSVGPINVAVYDRPSMDGVPVAKGVLGSGFIRTIQRVVSIQFGQPSASGQLLGGQIERGSVFFEIYGSAGLLATLQDNGTGILEGGGLFSEDVTGEIEYASGLFTIIFPNGSEVFDFVNVRYSTLGGQTTYPDTVPFNVIDGHLRQGDAWFFAYIDANNNNLFDTGEPASIVQRQPVRIDWAGTTTIDIGFTDDLIGYQRFSWAPNETNSYEVAIDLNGTNIYTKAIQHRSYFQEQDLLVDGLYGLDPGESFTNPTYTVIIYGSTNELLLFTDDWRAPLAKPSIVSPYGGDVVYARSELVWSQDMHTTYSRIQIRRGTNGPIIYNGAKMLPPFREVDGRYRVRLPLTGGSGDFTNGVYYTRVIAGNPKAEVASDWVSFRLDMQDAVAGAYTLAGRVDYLGRALSGTIVVQAFTTESFSDLPEAEVTLGINQRAFALRGLRAGNYYVRAFIDQNGNRRLDTFESRGMVRASSSTSFHDKPQRITAGPNQSGLVAWILDVDTDNDGLQDAWEYHWRTNITDLGFVNSYGDADSDGLNDQQEMLLSTNPFDADSDDDGISDLVEWVAGSDPLVTSGGSPASLLDSDGDGLTDAEEALLGTRTDKRDSDDDGLEDFDELKTGTDPVVRDSDGDGLNDGLEFQTLGTNPLRADTDGDGLSDGEEYDGSRNTRWTTNAFFPGRPGSTDPLNADTDADTLSDSLEVNVVGTDPNNPDTDGNGRHDGYDYAYGLVPQALNPGAGDYDGDGFADYFEVLLGLDYTSANSKPDSSYLFEITGVYLDSGKVVVAYAFAPWVTNITTNVNTRLVAWPDGMSGDITPASGTVFGQGVIPKSGWNGGPWSLTNQAPTDNVQMLGIEWIAPQ